MNPVALSWFAMPVITLLTDYGTSDHYVAAIKGVLTSLAPQAQVVDITHDIAPYNVAQAAFVLRQAFPWFPRGTVHVVVVDPGVGSERRILLGQYAGQFVLAPDNGLLTYVHRDFAADAVHVLEDRRLWLAQVSPTFHGRDIMAPAAAHLVKGVKPRSFGRVAERIELLAVPHRAEAKDGGWIGRVIYVDRFGTLVTNVRGDQLGSTEVRPRKWEVFVSGASLGPIRTAFHEVPPGAPLALMGSGGHLEIAVNQGRAVDRFAAVESLQIEVR